VRWRGWYKHDANSVQHVKTGLVARIDSDLLTPATVAAFIERHTNEGGCKLDAMDVVALLTCANELVWCAFDFAGIGDWVDENGIQRGREGLRAAV
jgi:hypothetical protein